MSMRGLLLAMGMFATSAMDARAEPETALAETPPRPVVSEIVGPVWQSPRSFVGVVAARKETTLAFTVQGRLAESDMKTGEMVVQDEILARLDPSDLDAALSSAEAGVVIAQAQLAQAQDAEARAIDLETRGAGSSTARQAGETARIAAEAHLEQALSQRDRAWDRRQAAVLKSPSDGVIVSVGAEPGAVVAAGQPIATLAGTDAREVRIDLGEVELLALPSHAAFTATLLAAPGVSAVARVRDVAPVAARQTRTRQVRLSLEDPPDGFRLGSLVTLQPADSLSAISLPIGALVQTDGKTAVWVVSRPEGRVMLIPVQTGDTRGGRILITEGLTDGQEVVVKGVHSLSEGQIVGPQVAG